MVPQNVTPPRFIVLDGVDGCGKSTQAELLVRALHESGRAEPLHLREPGTTRAGERIRELLLDQDVPLATESEVLLFAAARRQALNELVRPALEEGRDVVCERFHGSTFAYQAHAGGLDEALVLDLLERWCGDPRPDRTLLLDVAPRRALERRGGGDDRFESRGLEFQERVAEGYRRYAGLVSDVRVIDGDRDPESVAAEIWNEVMT